MSLSKRFLKSKPVCKVTFRLPAEAAPEAEKVTIVGEFNDWDKAATPMQKLKNGEFKLTIDLETGKEYQFRYLIDDETWENDWDADKYVPAEGSDNSVVDLLEQ
ncbi:MAG: glycoside hydrolase [Kangiellaceae bacterium]|jgi:1,4-alpha-glucan branching enzyme|nr:glycoside hydrolase [Kangiellaceae bacterium]|tara:strand:- start:5466 stop:5777 length:312 start_codon:yes stop_codon:yes gene_type:complete